MARRGRPRLSDTVAGATGTSDGSLSADSGNGNFSLDGADTINPADIGAAVDGNGGNFGSGTTGDSGDSDGTRTRRKYTRRAKSAKANVPVDVLSAVLFSGHAMLAGITKTPELALAEYESTELAKALSTVSAFYDVQVAEKTLAWINLAQVAGMIYGTRLVAMRSRKKPRVMTQEEPEKKPSEYTPNAPDDWFPGMGPLQ